MHRVATRAMNHERVAAHLPVVRQVADDLVDAMTADGRRADDLVAGYTDRLPLLTITRLLGIPADDCDRIRRWSGAYTHSHPGTPQALLPHRDGPKFVGFGGGRHYCPGRGLGRAILAVGLERLRTRLPGLRLATDGPFPIAEREVGGVVTTLPVRW
ncbi:hypothetical protein ACN265_28075 [Micromonospora sp. WMMD730]|uniref:hypothetical protein n=1 Tax=Micromonospora sp. WMMD730 TaxID=3404128 RepID=UPI003B93C96D